mgnify:CR=1 FL=1
MNAVSSTPADVKSAGDSLDRKFIDVEQTIVDLRLTGRGQDQVRWPVQLGGQLSYLAGGIGSSDFAPTTQQRGVNEILVKQMRATRAALEQLMSKDLAAFNALLRSRGLKTTRMVAVRRGTRPTISRKRKIPAGYAPGSPDTKSVFVRTGRSHRSSR